MATQRDNIRSALLGQPKKFKSETVEFGGIEVEVRQPNIRLRREILSDSVDANGKPDFFRSAITGVIELTYVPGTDQKVFDDTDRDELESQPPGGFVDDLIGAVTKVLNVDKKGTAKNSKETAKSS